MRDWKYICNRFKSVRDMLYDGTSRRDILIAISQCTDDIMKHLGEANWYFDDFYIMKEDISNDIEHKKKLTQNNLNDYLRKLYNLCDEADVFLAL